jgi:circadian clock protein KaiB
MPRKPARTTQTENIKSLTEFGQTIRETPTGQTYMLRLYVTGTTPRSTQAIENIRRICDEHLGGRYALEVIDIYQHPVLAQHEQIFAAPTLVKELPLPLRKLIGTMADEERVLLGLDLKPKARSDSE